MPAKKRLTFPFAVPEGQTASGADDYGGGEDGDGGNERRKFFVWTQLGEWCSEACYDAEHHYFRWKGYEEGEVKLRRLEAMRSDLVRDVGRARFLGALTQVIVANVRAADPFPAEATRDLSQRNGYYAAPA